MAGGAVHNGTVGDVFTIVNEDGPEVDEAKEEDVGHLLQREDEGEDVVRHTLGPAVKWVESVRGVGTGHDPLVVRLVQGLVDAGVVQTTVDPVDEEIGEADEEGELDEAVEGERLFRGGVVEFCESADFQNEEGRCEEGHWGHGFHSLSDLHSNLIAQELRVLVGGLVPDEDVGKRCDDKVDQKAKQPRSCQLRGIASRRDERIPSDQEETGELTVDIVARPGTQVGILGRLQIEHLGRLLIDERLWRPEEGHCAVGGIGEGRK